MDATLIGTGLFTLAAFVWVFCAYYAYQTAPRYGRRRGVWAVLGLIFGPIALMVLYVLPKGDHVTPAAHPGSEAARRTDPRADLYEVPKKKHR